MNRYFQTANTNSTTASASCAEASFACSDRAIVIMDTILVSIFVSIKLHISLIGDLLLGLVRSNQSVTRACT